MKGFVVTPPNIVDHMVKKLFQDRKPKSTEIVLDPGCGNGAFIDGILRYCNQNRIRKPKIIGVELNPILADECRARFSEEPTVDILHADFLDSDAMSPPQANYIIGNPPYVPITGLSVEEREEYRARYQTAVGRFDLYLLFFERSLELLAEGGHLCLITPEKFEYVDTAAPLRQKLSTFSVRELDHIHEDSFPGLVTYPVITSVIHELPQKETRVVLRDGGFRTAHLPSDGGSWAPALRPAQQLKATVTLGDICTRISAGVATGADEIYVARKDELPRDLARFTYDTISGRQLALQPRAGPIGSKDVLIAPYDRNGKLLAESHLGPLLHYLGRPDIRRRLESRTCVKRGKKAFYRFHDSFPISELLQPKILCKDITPEPMFWPDETGGIVPRHTVYYIIPRAEYDMQAILSYLNSSIARDWLRAHAQNAANGFVRLQTKTLQKLPVPEKILARASKGPTRPLTQVSVEPA